MRFRHLSAIVALFIVGAVLPPRGAEAQEDITVQGEIVDLACYLSKGSRGPSHRVCAQKCAERGIPIGVLTDDGNVFLLLEDHSDEDPYEEAKKLAGYNAEVKGKKFTKPGIVGIVVSEIKEQ